MDPTVCGEEGASFIHINGAFPYIVRPSGVEWMVVAASFSLRGVLLE